MGDHEKQSLCGAVIPSQITAQTKGTIKAGFAKLLPAWWKVGEERVRERGNKNPSWSI